MADSDNEKGKWVGVFLGPALIAVATCALWKNEGRYDYAKAAAATEELVVLSDATQDELVSYTDEMDRDLTLPGDYIQQTVGYLTVKRDAEIYCWDRRQDDDHVTWTMRWMSSVESNSRNTNVRQQLSSKNFRPHQYQVGDLIIQSEKMEYVDSYETIPVSSLELTDEAKIRRINRGNDYLVLNKGQSRGLGDERVSYSGIPVPETATYFGKIHDGMGTAHQAVKRGGFIDSLIQDTGVLHHLVAGDRKTALASMKRHIKFVRWMVRGAGTAATVFGFVLFGSAVLGFLLHLPIIGGIAEMGIWFFSIFAGITLATLTIVSSYLIHHPIGLAAVIAVVGTLIYLGFKKGKKSQTVIKQDLETQYGRELGNSDMKELEFLELAYLALSDAKLDANEKQYLKDWSRKHGWTDDKFNEMLKKAATMHESPSNQQTSQEHLTNLIKLALADGRLMTYELRSIQLAAKDLGYDRATVQELMEKVKAAAAA